MKLGPIVAGGDCLVREPGKKTLFVSEGIPGEDVDVAVFDDRKDLARARVTKVLERSPIRIEEPCPMRQRGCGGCQWQHINFNNHAELKVGIVRDALQRIAKIAEPKLRFAGSVEPFNYRTTMRMPIVDGRAALHIRNSNDAIALDLCMIAHPLLEEIIVEGRFPDATEIRIRASVATKERTAWIVGGSAKPTLPEDVTVTRNGRKAFVFEKVNGLPFRLSPRAFFQSCPQAASLLVNTVQAYCPPDAHLILDAYSGVGVFGAIIGSQLHAQVIAIEQDGASVNDAKVNLAPVDARIVLGEVAAVRPEDIGTPSVIIADPARSGLGPSATRALTALESPRIILVSCDPASLARDTTLLAKGGYELGSVDVLDLFPQTHHVETVSVFTKK